MTQNLSEIVQGLRRFPISELGGVSLLAADAIERLVFIIAEYVAAQDQYDRDGASEDSIQRLRLAKQALRQEARPFTIQTKHR